MIPDPFIQSFQRSRRMASMSAVLAGVEVADEIMPIYRDEVNERRNRQLRRDLIRDTEQDKDNRGVHTRAMKRSASSPGKSAPAKDPKLAPMQGAELSPRQLAFFENVGEEILDFEDLERTKAKGSLCFVIHN